MQFTSLFFHTSEYAQNMFWTACEPAIAMHQETQRWQDFKTAQYSVASFCDKENMVCGFEDL